MASKNTSTLKDERAFKWHDRLLVIPLVVTASAIFMLSFVRADKPEVAGIASTPNGQGAWIIYDNGEIVAKNASSDDAYGDELPIGDVVAIRQSSNGGFWAVTRSGNVIGYNGAPYHGGTDGGGLIAPIVDIIVQPDQNSYRLVGSDGTVYDFNVDALENGSLSDMGITQDQLESDIVAALSTPSGEGYWLFAENGTVYGVGDAAALGGSSESDGKVVAVNAHLDGYVISTENGTHVVIPNSNELECLDKINGQGEVLSSFTISSNGNSCWSVDNNGNITELRP